MLRGACKNYIDLETQVSSERKEVAGLVELVEKPDNEEKTELKRNKYSQPST